MPPGYEEAKKIITYVASAVLLMVAGIALYSVVKYTAEIASIVIVVSLLLSVIFTYSYFKSFDYGDITDEHREKLKGRAIKASMVFIVTVIAIGLMWGVIFQ